jgi:hypothetical protein
VISLCGNHDDWMLPTRRDFRKHTWLLATDPFVTMHPLIRGGTGFPERYRGQDTIVYGHHNNAVLTRDGWPQPAITGGTIGIDTISHGVLTAVRMPGGDIIQSARHSDVPLTESIAQLERHLTIDVRIAFAGVRRRACRSRQGSPGQYRHQAGADAATRHIRPQTGRPVVTPPKARSRRCQVSKRAAD